MNFWLIKLTLISPSVILCGLLDIQIHLNTYHVNGLNLLRNLTKLNPALHIAHLPLLVFPPLPWLCAHAQAGVDLPQP